jgi:hypothetical protein
MCYAHVHAHAHVYVNMHVHVHVHVHVRTCEREEGLICNAPGVRFGLTSGHEKAAFVKARARLPRGAVYRESGDRRGGGTQHGPLC